MKEALLTILSFAIGLYCIKFLRSYDIHEKEPVSKMVLVAILGGACSVAISLFLYKYLEIAGIKDVKNTFGALFVIGPVEESSKLAALCLSVLFIKRELNEPTDGLIYMSCVALGFSLIENFFYAAHSPHPIQMMAIRIIISTPMHISFSIFMGLALYALVKYRTGWWLLSLSLVYAFVAHGIYDLIIFNEFILIFLIITIRVAHTWTLSLLGYTTAVSPNRTTLRQFIENYNNPSTETGLECLHCGDLNLKSTFRLGSILIQQCHNCSFYVTTRDSLFHIFHRFGSTFKNLSNHYGVANEPHQGFYTLHKGNFVSDQKKIAYFDLEEMNDVLEEFTRRSVQKNGGIRTRSHPPTGVACRFRR